MGALDGEMQCVEESTIADCLWDVPVCYVGNATHVYKCLKVLILLEAAKRGRMSVRIFSKLDK